MTARSVHGRPDGIQAVILEGSTVFLQLRPFPLGWELPGGHVEPGERPEDAAAREVAEETGFHIGPVRRVGRYTWTGLRTAVDLVVVTESYSGTFRPTLEAVRGKFFPLGDLPATVFPWIPRRILDAVDALETGAGEVERLQPVGVAHVLAFAATWMLAPLEPLVRKGGHAS